MAQLLLGTDQGVVNTVLGEKDPIDWLGNSDLNIWMMMLAASWRHTGYVMILYGSNRSTRH
ncbi:hypothetical protein SALBM135S_07424 [Streptomyces alboniger]